MKLALLAILLAALSSSAATTTNLFGATSAGDPVSLALPVAGLPKPMARKMGLITASGIAGATSQSVFGDTANASGGPDSSVTFLPPTATRGAMRQAKAASGTIDTGIFGNPNYRTGRNIYFSSSAILFFLTTTNKVNFYIGLTDQILLTMGNSTNPAGNYAAFQFSTNLAQPNIQTVTKDATTQLFSVTSVPMDQAIHKYEITFNDSIPNVVFSIDNAVVATHSANLPLANINLNYIFGGTIFSPNAGQATNAFEYIYIESDR